MSTPSFAQTLTSLELNVTKSRIAILEIFQKNPQPLDVGEIIAQLAQRKVDTDQATVYRTLDVFVKNHLVDRLEFQEGKFRYELLKNEHHHLICEQCGRIEDVLHCPISEVEEAIAKKNKFVIKRHALEFFGICSQCQETT